MSSPRRRKVTRYGPIPDGSIKFGTEERFAWQRAQYVSDVVYKLPDTSLTRDVIFSSSVRQGMDAENPDAKKRSTGPGSYNPGNCYDHISEYIARKGNRFGAAPRESMAMKTPSPGAIYQIEKCYYMGPEKNKGISFNCDNRPPLNAGGGCGANADVNCPPLPKGPSITIAGRWKEKNLSASGPGAVYDVHKVLNFKTGPSFSFGKGKGDRFKAVGMLSSEM